MQQSDRTRRRASAAIIVIVFLTIVIEVLTRLQPNGISGIFISHRGLYPVSILIMCIATLAFLRLRSDSYWRVPFTLAAFFFSLYLAEFYRIYALAEGILAALPAAFSGSGSPAPWLVARSFVYVAVLILLAIFWLVDGSLAVTRPRMGRLRDGACIGRWKMNWRVLLPFAMVLAVGCGMAMSVHLRDKPYLFMHFIPHYFSSKILGALNNAFAEEILFRAVLLQSFRKAVGDRMGNVLQAVVFAGGHVSWGPLGIIALGLTGYFVWGKSALATRGILWAVITHAAAVVGLVWFVGW